MHQPYLQVASAQPRKGLDVYKELQWGGSTGCDSRWSTETYQAGSLTYEKQLKHVWHPDKKNAIEQIFLVINKIPKKSHASICSKF